MTDLLDFQHQIGDGPVFGAGTAYPVGDWLHAVAELRVGDVNRDMGDGTDFGDDLESGVHFEFGLGVKVAGDPAGAGRALRALAASWSFADRRTPGAVAPYRFKLPGQGTRVVFGRPRKFDPDWTSLVNGWLPVSATFDAEDGSVYGDVAVQEVLSISWTGDPVGLVVPVTAPIVFAPDGYSPEFQGQFRNDGDRTAWPVVRFEGPASNPRVTWPASGAYIDLAMVLGVGDWVEVDCHPARHTVLLNGDRSVYSAFAKRRSTFPGLPSGTTALRYTAQQNDATTYCRVTARPAYTLL